MLRFFSSMAAVATRSKPAEKIQLVRQRTGSPISQCKEALTTFEGDVERSVRWLQQNGVAVIRGDSAVLRQNASAGLVGLSMSKAAARFVTLRCETDFVASNDRFKGLLQSILSAIPETSTPISRDALLQLPSNELAADAETGVSNPQKMSLGRLIEQTSSVMGEAMHVDSLDSITFADWIEKSDITAHYMHNVVMPFGGSAAAIAILRAPGVSENAKLHETMTHLARSIAMQCVVCPPKYISTKNIPIGDIEQYRSELLEISKEAPLSDKDLEQRLLQWRRECVLEEGPFGTFPYFQSAAADQFESTFAAWKSPDTIKSGLRRIGELLKAKLSNDKLGQSPATSSKNDADSIRVVGVAYKNVYAPAKILWNLPGGVGTVRPEN